MLNNFNLKETGVDTYVLISKTNNHLLIVAIFINIDDGLKAETNNELVNDLVRCFKDKFQTKEGDLDQFLGIEMGQRIN